MRSPTTPEAVPPSVEALARAMCAALGDDPDERFSHGANFSVYPRLDRSKVPAATKALHYSPNWCRYVWQAHKWMFEKSGGELPRVDE